MDAGDFQEEIKRLLPRLLRFSPFKRVKLACFRHFGSRLKVFVSFIKLDKNIVAVCTSSVPEIRGNNPLDVWLPFNSVKQPQHQNNILFLVIAFTYGFICGAFWKLKGYRNCHFWVSGLDKKPCHS